MLLRVVVSLFLFLGGGLAAQGLKQRPLLKPLNFPQSQPASQRYELVNAFPDLEFEKALFVTSLPKRSDRLYVVEQTGRIYSFVNDPNAASTDLFLDISSKLSSAAGEEGLLGLAFDPNFATSQEFYVYYTAPRPLRTVISRFKARSETSADSGSEQVVLEFGQPWNNHNGGMIAFGPDGMLYVGTGDGGSGGDPQGNGQKTSTLLGKILRIDPRGTATYRTPSDNPFVGQSGYRPEIWALGLRNPWRFSFDRSTGDLWVGDVGQDKFEEIDLVAKGDNLGWNPCEGKHRYPGNGPCPSTFKAPIHEYSHAVGQSVVGGYVYRGNRLPGLKGIYLYGDTLSREIWGIQRQGNQVAAHLEFGKLPVYLTSLGEDGDGEVYFVGYGEAAPLYRLQERAGPLTALPPTLSKTGLFDDTARLQPNPGLIEFAVNSPLWSDGAIKRRWLALPNHATVQYDPYKPWKFPLGTVLVKHFEVAAPGGGMRRLETRVLIKNRNDWQGFTYRWDASQRDAQLLAQAATETLSVPDGNGGTQTQLWTYPAPQDCLRCHTPSSGFALGLTASQLNRDFDFPLGRYNQLATWNQVGLFSQDLSLTSHPSLVDPADTTQSLTHRARAYLEANCASCHRPVGGTPTDLDLRAHVPLADTRLVDVPASSGDLGLVQPMRVKRGDPGQSVLWVRLQRMDEKRMPPLGSHVVDAEGVALIGDWIKSL